MPNPSSDKKNRNKFFILALFLFACWIAGRFTHFDETSFRSFFERFPPAVSGTVYVALYIGLTFFIWVAKDVLKVVGLLIFGVPLSSLLIWIAECFNAVILFHFSRRLGRSFVEKSLKGRFRESENRLGQAGFVDLLALRTIILVPFRFLDLIMGLTKMDKRKYFTAVALGSPLRILMLQWYISLMKDLVTKDFKYIVDYLSANTYLGVLGFAYLVLVGILVFRLKKIVWG